MKFRRVYQVNGGYHIGFDDDDGWALANVGSLRNGKWRVTFSRAYLRWESLGEYDTPLDAVAALLACDLPNVGSFHYVAKRAKEMGVPVLHRVPDGWRVIDGAATAPHGSVWVGHGSRFGGDYEHGLLYVGR